MAVAAAVVVLLDLVLLRCCFGQWLGQLSKADLSHFYWSHQKERLLCCCMSLWHSSMTTTRGEGSFLLPALPAAAAAAGDTLLFVCVQSVFKPWRIKAGPFAHTNGTRKQQQQPKVTICIAFFAHRGWEASWEHTPSLCLKIVTIFLLLSLRADVNFGTFLMLFCKKKSSQILADSFCKYTGESQYWEEFSNIVTLLENHTPQNRGSFMKLPFHLSGFIITAEKTEITKNKARVKYEPIYVVGVSRHYS